MKVSLNWLKELVEYELEPQNLADLLSLKTIGTKEVNDQFIELDMKGYNRADLLSLRGVAIEVAAITNSPVKFKDEVPHFDLDLPKTPIKIADKTLCVLQCVAKIEGLKVGNSKEEWVTKLKDSGMRSVNNIADITNLIMLEYGQPLHAFDAETVKDDTINVRLALEGESITTLDGKLRSLSSEDIVLADEDKALDVAGVMGGKETEINDKTNTILLSASLFNPQMIRKTSQRLKLQSEASKRFYHGLTLTRLLQSLAAAIKMYESLGGRLTAITIVGETEDPIKEVHLSTNKVRSLVGVDLTDQEIRSSLESLGFKINTDWNVEVPYYRLDITYQEDLIEEIARMYGYDKIPSLDLKGDLPEKINQSLFVLIASLRTNLVHLGLIEVQTYSFFSTKVLSALGWNENLDFLIQLENPMSSETTYLRQCLWANLVEVIDKNIRQSISDQAIFEIGKTYMITPDKTIEEKYSLAIALTNKTENPIAELSQIFKKLELDVEIMEDDHVPPPIRQLFHPNRLLAIKHKGVQIGGMSEIHPKTLDKFGVTQRVAVCEIYLDSLLNHELPNKE
jgi:phenylalanyl-tRNA synthetase beta chain